MPTDKLSYVYLFYTRCDEQKKKMNIYDTITDLFRRKIKKGFPDFRAFPEVQLFQQFQAANIIGCRKKSEK